jgi:hypothetical protein
MNSRMDEMENCLLRRNIKALRQEGSAGVQASPRCRAGEIVCAGDGPCVLRPVSFDNQKKGLRVTFSAPLTGRGAGASNRARRPAAVAFLRPHASTVAQAE